MRRLETRFRWLRWRDDEEIIVKFKVTAELNVADFGMCADAKNFVLANGSAEVHAGVPSHVLETMLRDHGMQRQTRNRRELVVSGGDVAKTLHRRRIWPSVT